VRNLIDSTKGVVGSVNFVVLQHGLRFSVNAPTPLRLYLAEFSQE
jgi:hypothetical protein